MEDYQEENLARALSASSRREVLRLLGEKELTVKEITQKTGMSMSLASRHLQLLSDLGFLNTRREAPFKFYSLKIPELIELLELWEIAGYSEENLARAISAGSRREVLRLLGEKELTVKEITQKTGMSMSLASRHLTLLSDLGFLKVRREPPYKFYSLKVKELIEVLEIYDKVLDNSLKP